MTRRSANLFWFSFLALCGVLLIGQDCAAQCDGDPCATIPNAVGGTCTEVGGGCVPDYFCSCDSEYTWQGGTHICTTTTPTELEGTWVGYEADDPFSEWTVVFVGNTQDYRCPETGESYYGTFSLNTGVVPKEIDYFIVESPHHPPWEGLVSLKIYLLEGDSLTVAVNEPGEPTRPSDFIQGGTPYTRVFEFTRQ